jgi:hypothetical protein
MIWIAPGSVDTNCFKNAVLHSNDTHIEDRDKLVEQRVRFSNQLTSTLKDYFPQALDAFGRNTFHQLAFCSFQASQWAISGDTPETPNPKQNAKKRKEGKKSNHALRCIATGLR